MPYGRQPSGRRFGASGFPECRYRPLLSQSSLAGPSRVTLVTSRRDSLTVQPLAALFVLALPRRLSGVRIQGRPRGQSSRGATEASPRNRPKPPRRPAQLRAEPYQNRFHCAFRSLDQCFRHPASNHLGSFRSPKTFVLCHERYRCPRGDSAYMFPFGPSRFGLALHHSPNCSVKRPGCSGK